MRASGRNFAGTVANRKSTGIVAVRFRRNPRASRQRRALTSRIMCAPTTRLLTLPNPFLRGRSQEDAIASRRGPAAHPL